MKTTMRGWIAAMMLGAMLHAQVGALSQQAGQTTGQAAGQQNSDQGPTYTLKVSTDIVLTNLIVRDKKTGEVVKNLKPSDFQIFENKKPQRIASFDYQDVNDAAVIADKAKPPVTGVAKIANLVNNDMASDPKELRDHRLMVMFFDLSSMQPDDVDRAVTGAKDFVRKQMQPADLVALVSLSTGLTMDQDFTADKDALIKGLGKYDGSEGQGFTAGGDGTTAGTSDDATSFTADDSEYASLNTDRELYAIQEVAKALEHVDSRKSMLYFSGGLTRQGIENQASLRSATNEAVKANMAIYSVDSRGLQALSPLGDATRGSLRGTAAYSGLGDAEPVEVELLFAGDAGHAELRYRRQVFFGLERFCAGVPAGAA